MRSPGGDSFASLLAEYGAVQDSLKAGVFSWVALAATVTANKACKQPPLLVLARGMLMEVRMSKWCVLKFPHS